MFKRAALLSVLMLFGVLLSAAPAVAAIDLAPSTPQLEFGEVDLHGASNPTQSVTFSDGDPLGSTLIESATITGPDAANFHITSDGCSGVLLENLKGCSVEVVFETLGLAGTRSASLELQSNEGPVEVALSATATTGTLSANPSPLSFAPIPFTAPGTHNEGEYNETEGFQIQNSANAGTRIEGASIVGPDASSFSIQWNCEGVVLNPSNSCGMGVRFQPTSPGAKSASLVINNDSGTPLLVPLEGVGLHGPQLDIDNVQALLGSVPLGSSARHTFNLTNSGDYPLFIQRAFLVTGTPLMFPILSDSCTGQILYPSESCAITVAFRPTTLGEKSGALLFITNTPAITVAGIDGTGVAANEASTTRVADPLEMPGAPTPPTGPASAPAPSPALAASPTPPATLAAARPPRLFSLLRRSTLDPGADVQCPVSQSTGCEALSLLLPTSRASGSDARLRRGAALLGSALVHLRAGDGTHVRGPTFPTCSQTTEATRPHARTAARRRAIRRHDPRPAHLDVDALRGRRRLARRRLAPGRTRA